MLLFIPSFSHSITPDCTTPDDALKEVLSHEIIQTIASLSSEVLSRCPQATCRVIRIGRSPTTIVAYFQSQYHKYNWNILLGDSRYGVKYEPLHKDFKLKLFITSEAIFLMNQQTKEMFLYWIMELRTKV